AGGPAGLDHGPVVRQRRVGELALGRLDPRPLHREPVGVQAHPGHQIDVLTPQLVAVARRPGRLTEDRWLNMFQEPGVAAGVVALHLMPGGRSTPAETRRERSRRPCLHAHTITAFLPTPPRRAVLAAGD